MSPNQSIAEIAKVTNEQIEANTKMFAIEIYRITNLQTLPKFLGTPINQCMISDKNNILIHVER